MTHVDDLPVQDEMETSRSEKTDRLDMSQTPRDNGEQVTVEASEPDARRMEDTTEEKTLRDVKDGVKLRDAMDDRSVGEEKDMQDKKDEGKQKDDREEKHTSGEKDVGEEKNVWEEKKMGEEENKYQKDRREETYGGEENEEEDYREKDRKEKKVENNEREEKNIREEKDRRERKRVRTEDDLREDRNMRGKDMKEEKNTSKIEQRSEDIIGNRIEERDAIWTRNSETGVTTKAWKVPVTRTGDAAKGANNALLICSGKKTNKFRMATNESSTTKTGNGKKIKEEKKAKATRKLLQRMKVSNIKKATGTGTVEKSEPTQEANLKELKTEKTNEMDKLSQIDTTKQGNKNNVDKKLWRKKTRIFLSKIWSVASIVGQYTEIILTNLKSYNVSFGI